MLNVGKAFGYQAIDNIHIFGDSPGFVKEETENGLYRKLGNKPFIRSIPDILEEFAEELEKAFPHGLPGIQNRQAPDEVG